MASYSKVSLLLWKDREIRKLVRSGEQVTALIFVYLLTCDHRNSEGLYWLPKEYVESDLALDADEVSRRFAALMDRRRIEYDEEAEVVFLPNALKHHEPKSKPQIKGAIAALERVPETHLFGSFVSAAETHAPTLAKELRKVFKDRLGN